MRPRSPINQRPRRGGLKCEFCSRSYPSADRLRSHQISLHAAALKEKAKKSFAKKVGKPLKGVKAKVVSKPQPKPVKTKPKLTKANTPAKTIRKETYTKETLCPMVEDAKFKQESTTEKIEKKVEMDLKASTKMRKVEFKCPTCIKIFPVYFSAMRHIQKHHNNKGSSSKPVTPIRTEFCIFCNSMVSNDIEDHKCEPTRDLTGLSLTYVCTGCNQKFQSMRLFDIHISGVHSEGVESMFFPNIEEFNNWKDSMEKQTESSYLIMGKYQYKQIYRCSNTTVKEEDENSPSYFCPSMLIFQEFTKGIQVHFYKGHYGHPCTKYVLLDKYKTYSITDMLHQAMGYSEMTNVRSEENDLYCQFKKLMESIVLDAAKINVETLKTLIGKALEMISVLKNYKDDDDSLKLPLSISGNDELAKALEALNKSTKPVKRSVTTSIEVIPGKRLKSETASQEKSPILQKALPKPKAAINKFSLADDRDEQKILKELGGAYTNKVASPIPTPIKKTVESPSFNDTYKNFVERNLNTPVTVKKNVPVKNSVQNKVSAPAKKKVVVKTKMGQFKPGSSPKKTAQNSTETSMSPKKTAQNSTETSMVPKKTAQNSTETSMAPKKTAQNSTETSMAPKKTAQNSTETSMAPKKSAQNNTETSMSPKKTILNGTVQGRSRVSRSSAGTANDIKYEVKEQENDCNILILKI